MFKSSEDERLLQLLGVKPIEQTAHEYEVLVSMNEYYLNVHQELLNFHILEKQEDLALGRAYRLLNFKKNDLRSYQLYLKAAIYFGKYKEAYPYAYLANQKFDDNPTVKTQWSYILFKNNYFEESRKIVYEALQIDPQMAEAYSVLAELAFYENMSMPDVEKFAQLGVNYKTSYKQTKYFLIYALMAQKKWTQVFPLINTFEQHDISEFEKRIDWADFNLFSIDSTPIGPNSIQQNVYFKLAQFIKQNEIPLNLDTDKSSRFPASLMSEILKNSR